MNMFDRGIPLNEDDCIEFENDTTIRLGKLKSALKDLNTIIQDLLAKNGIIVSEKISTTSMIRRRRARNIQESNYTLDLIEEGVPCEILKANSSGWQKGKLKIRVSVEFYPDEPESIEPPPSPLDDIRQSMS
ncbi:KGK domain-containing protein [Pannus brasiliensis CCIBt3594]|uniref:KGK domain-containing protein n=1 Tax=Pannus brasiliensis CCIBt3594 TaxID=1427578 RepID=A0AAW9QXQ2_9CHRO